jgi:hypothetical protein
MAAALARASWKAEQVTTTQLPWQFEACSPEDATDPAGQPWQHAVRGRKPAGRVVTGYGHTPPAADADARTKATQYDAREVLGERGEVKVPTMPPVKAAALAFFKRYGVSETMLLDAGWRVEDGAWIAPQSLIDLEETYD